MAGETPDKSGRSEQRNPGEAAKGEDPRLAVTRDEEKDSPVDQPTAVFSTKDASEPKGGSEAESEAESAEEPGEESESEADSGADADADEVAEDGKDARLRAAVAAWVAGTDDDAAKDAPAKGESEEEPADSEEESPEEPPKKESEEADDTEEATSDEAEAAAEDDKSEEPKEADEADQPEEAEEAEEAEDADEAEESEAPDAPDAGPVDQATAVFKTVKPKEKQEKPKPEQAKKAVDQPTAMLKLPADAEADKDEQKEADEPEPKPKSEAEAERTSKFVALKPLDEPKAPKKPEQPPKAAALPAEAKAEAKPEPEAKPEAPTTGPERTTQQPLPPKPPLDLLAELTNRPPPPETLTRTMVRRVKIWTPLVLLILIVFAVVQTVRPLPTPTLGLTANEKYTFDGSKPSLPWPTEGQAVVDVNGIGRLGTYGEEKPIPIGSVAKVMTAYVILKEHKDKDPEKTKLTVDKAAEEHYQANSGPNGESVVKVKEGDQITLKEAIQDIMLPSANNIAKLLARWDSDGNEEAFVKKMNDAAKDLGMKNTKYTDASGLAEATVSTAVDQVKLGKAAMEIPLFKEIVRMPTFKSTTSDRPEDGRNFNKLVPVYGTVGIKTGSTSKAGGNLLFAAEKEINGTKQLIIGAVFGQHAPPIIDTAMNKSKDLILRTGELLESRTVVKKGDVVGQVDDGLGGTTPVVATKDVSAVGWPGLTVELALADGGKTLPHEAKAGEKIGVLSVGDGEKGAVKVPVALQEDLVEPGFGSKLTRLG